MAKLKVKIETVCAASVSLDPTGKTITVVPFMESLRAVRASRTAPLPAKTFYWLNKISAVLEKEFTEYEEARVQLVVTLGSKTETGYIIPPEKAAEFKKEIASLNGEIELPIEEGVKLALPASGVAEDWFPLMAALDIFEEPPA